MNLAEYAARLAAAAPQLTAEQVEGAARILAGVANVEEVEAA